MKVDREVMNVLSNAHVDGAALLLVGQLDRKLYERTNKVLEAAGGKWNRSKKVHLFDSDASDRIEQIILTGDVVAPKDEFEFFATPAVIARQVVDLADIGDGMMVLEPSAGRGALATLAQQAAPGVMVNMYELMEENNQALVELGLPLSSVASPCDFLTTQPAPVYDRVVMNPPFGKQADIRHVLHALKFLKPGGKLVSVMAAGVMFRENRLTVDFRAVVEASGGHFEELPDAAFKESGTMVSTVIVVIPSMGAA